MQLIVENKKIRNTQAHSYEGIKFRSGLEVTCFKILKEKNISPIYEAKHYALFEGYTPQVPFYSKNTFKRKNKRISVVSSSTVIDSRKVASWIYTPDFYFEYGDYIVHIEVKGFRNDVARYKIKLFRYQLEAMQNRDPNHIYEFWEIHTKKQLLDCIEHIKQV